MFNYIRETRDNPNVCQNINKHAFASDLLNRYYESPSKARVNVNMMSNNVFVAIFFEDVTYTVFVLLTDNQQLYIFITVKRIKG